MFLHLGRQKLGPEIQRINEQTVQSKQFTLIKECIHLNDILYTSIDIIDVIWHHAYIL